MNKGRPFDPEIPQEMVDAIKRGNDAADLLKSPGWKLMRHELTELEADALHDLEKCMASGPALWGRKIRWEMLKKLNLEMEFRMTWYRDIRDQILTEFEPARPTDTNFDISMEN
jgi:hypothetical protein